MSDNPKLIIENIKLNNGKKNIRIIQDGYLMCGTKQRIVVDFMKTILKKNKIIQKFVYSGTYHGFGAVAAAYGAHKLGLKCDVFLSLEGKAKKDVIHSRQLTTLKKLGAKIYLCSTYREARNLKYKIVDEVNNKGTSYILPMGLNDEEGVMINILAKKIKMAAKNTALGEIKEPRIWMVAGSGGISMAIAKAFPKAKIFILLTGAGRHKKRVIQWAKSNDNITIIRDELEDKNSVMNREKYYSSVSGYDDLIWPYVKKYSENNDFIWNVASDDYLLLPNMNTSR